jgi:hypothetical protein
MTIAAMTAASTKTATLTQCSRGESDEPLATNPPRLAPVIIQKWIGLGNLVHL